MGVKYFCDKCGNEFKSNGLVVPVYARDAHGIKLFDAGNKYLCDECTKKFELVKDRLEHEEDFFEMTDDSIALMEYDFKVGDIVVTDTGEVGFIESICDCEQCKKRRFYEPTAKMIDGNDTIYITCTCKNNGFKSFYQIGKYKFGNLDKESVKRWIKSENNNIKEANERIKRYEKQLKRLKRLEICDDDEDESIFGLDWLL